MVGLKTLLFRGHRWNLRQFERKFRGWKHQTRLLSSSIPSSGVHTDFTVKDGVGVVRLISPGKVNVLNKEVKQEFEAILKEFYSSPSIKSGLLISNKPECFIAGADINMISSLKTKEDVVKQSHELQEVLQGMVDSRKPLVAAIMGSCLGGGLEVALACHYRLAVSGSSTFAFPEVMLGLLPGAGGTQRLPKLIGLPDSLDMVLTGKNIRADKAKKMGLVDMLVDSLGPGLKDAKTTTLEHLEEIAMRTARDIADGKIKINRSNEMLSRKVLDQALKFDFAKNYVFKQAQDKVMKQTHGLYPAPLRILKAVRTGLDKGEKEGYRNEAEGFGELAMTSESKGLISLFQGQTECKKNKFKQPQRKTETLAVIGAGLMGAGIAQVSSMKGYRTLLKDNDKNGLARGLEQISKGYQDALKRKKMTTIQSEKGLSNIIPTNSDYSKLGKVDMVIEAIVEELDVKKKVLQEIEKHTPEHCIYATNTSALPITKIAEASKRPDKVIGMHYFSPVDKMMLLEIVKTAQTSEDTISRAVDVGLRQGKIPIVVADGPGFYTSRIMMPLMNHAFFLITEGLDPFKLDEATVKFGFPIGLATLADEIGLDVGNHVFHYLTSVLGKRFETFPTELGNDMIKAGFTGRKVGKGTFIYEGNTKVVNQEALKLIERRFKPQPKIPHTLENIQLMPTLRMVNEAVICLEDQIIANPLEGDIAAVFGLGFPPFTGGPFHFVDKYGSAKLVDKMREYEQQYGNIFTPCQTLQDYAKDPSKKFFKQ